MSWRDWRKATKHLSQGSRFPGRNLNLEPPEYESTTTFDCPKCMKQSGASTVLTPSPAVICVKFVELENASAGILVLAGTRLAILGLQYILVGVRYG